MSEPTEAEGVTSPVEGWFYLNPWIYGVIGAVVLGAVALFFTVCLCCFCYRRRKRLRDGAGQRLVGNENGNGNGSGQGYGAVSNGGSAPSSGREPSVVEEMNRQRREQESADRANAQTSVEFYVHNTRRNDDITPLPDMGSRMQKYWFKVQSKSGGPETLLTIAPVSQRCPVKLDTSTVNAINSLMRELEEHPYLHRITEVAYIGNKSQLIICQPMMTRGSLKDIIYKATPTSDWSQKYSRRSKGLSADKVALYGRHILEAMLFLYSKGFPILGHVQSGNCFVYEDRCLLGGYENTILGYKTRLYRLLKDYVEKIDILMFGHLLFEMSCGYELTTLTPRDSDYNCVVDIPVREVLQFIFQRPNLPTIQAIKNHEFFNRMQVYELDGLRDKVNGSFASDVRNLLKSVGKGKPVAKQPKKSKTPNVPPNKKRDPQKKDPQRETLLVEEHDAEAPPTRKPVPTPRQKK